MISIDMLGLSEFVAQVKTPRTYPNAVSVTMQHADVPRTMQQYCNNTEILDDGRCVNDVPFLISISEDVYCGTENSADSLKHMSL